MKLRKQDITAASLKGNKFTAISPKRMSRIKGLNRCPHAHNLKKLKTNIYILLSKHLLLLRVHLIVKAFLRFGT